jgi:hypothetical protein
LADAKIVAKMKKSFSARRVARKVGVNDDEDEVAQSRQTQSK